MFISKGRTVDKKIDNIGRTSKKQNVSASYLYTISSMDANIDIINTKSILYNKGGELTIKCKSHVFC